MATLGIRIVYSNNNSALGHMYVVFKGDDGSVKTFGMYPGGVTNKDKSEHEEKIGLPGTNGIPDVSRDFFLSPTDYQKALDYATNAQSQAGQPFKIWGDYDPFTRSCVDFTWNVMREAGLNKSSWFEGYPLPSWNKDPLSNEYFDFYRRPEFNREGNRAISPTLGTTPDPLIKTRRFIDPLILDLDGDGLEITGLAAGVLFDANGDTIKTGTAWAGADDGILVRDIDGNGTIDSGKELFGDETILTTGANAGQKAANGFAALADLDSNADGVFNATDAQYVNLKIWRDLNQDGISQVNELKTLADSGVQSVQLNGSSVNVGYGDATLLQSGSFTHVDELGNVSQGQAGSFIFAQNNFTTAFVPITVSTAAKALPALHGSGWVRDLQEAATLQPDLIALVAQTQVEGTREQFKEAVSKLMLAWGAGSGFTSASKDGLAAGFGLILSEPINTQELGWMDIAIKATANDRESFRSTLSTIDRGNFDAMRERMVGALERLHAYEAFTGHTFLDWNQVYADSVNYVARVPPGAVRPAEAWVSLTEVLHDNRNAVAAAVPGYLRVAVPWVNDTIHFNVLWNRLVTDSVSNLLQPLKLSKYLDMVDLVIDPNGAHFDFTTLNAALATLQAGAPHLALQTQLDLQKVYGDQFGALGRDSGANIKPLLQLAGSDAAIHAALIADGYGFLGGTNVVGSVNSDIYLGQADANQVAGAEGDDLLAGGDGNDSLTGGVGDDMLWGDDGADFLGGEEGNDYLNGGAGADVLYGYLGNDVLVGGQGNDTLRGWDGADTYLINAGDGIDLIQERSHAEEHSNRIVFGAGVLAADFTLSNSNPTDLLLTHVNGTDKVTVINWFVQGGSPFESISFADGTTWQDADVNARVLTHLGTAGDDTLRGTVLQDSYSGGLGSDRLEDEAGSDTYYFNLGDGQDTILDMGSSGFEVGDRIVFGVGILPEHISILWAGDNLQFKHINGSDQITVEGWMVNSVYRIENVAFANGVVWTAAFVTTTALTVHGTPDADTLTGTQFTDVLYVEGGDDTLYGMAGDDRLYGGDGSDLLYGEDGANVMDGGNGDDFIYGTVSAVFLYYRFNSELGYGYVPVYQYGYSSNTLLGGAGDDYLWVDALHTGNNDFDGGIGNDQITGSVGADVYRFNLGGGSDVIHESELFDSPVDRLIFGPGILSSAVTAEGWGEDLRLRVAGGQDQVSIAGWFVDPGAQIESIEFADGTVWTAPTVTQAALNVVGTGAADEFSGTKYGDIQHGLGGNDTLVGNAGDDQLFGGDSNDLLFGGSGSNLLAGNQGDDAYFTDSQTDVLVELLGEGVDTVTSLYSYVLGENFENMTLGFYLSINGTGNEGDNVLVGNYFDNVLMGLGGADTLQGNSGNDVLMGGAGNDTYIVDYVGATIAELVGEGIDLVRSSIEMTLADNVENLTLVGTAAINATGNALANVLTGNSAVNTLTGGGGDDSYVVSTGDIVIEAANAGTDTVFSAGNWTLALDVENLVLTGTSAVNATGNVQDNDISGNSAANTLSGLAGNDLYRYNIGGGADRVVDSSGLDRIVFGAGITSGQITATRTGSVVNLAVNANDSVSIDQISSGVYAIEQFEFANGAVLGASWLLGLIPSIAPVATNLSAAEAYTEDTAKNLTDIVVSDADSTNTTVTLTLSNAAAGSLNVGTSGAVTSAFNASTGVWTAAGAIASVNALLAALTFTPTANFNGNFTLATSVTDGASAPVSGVKNFTGTKVNDAPTGGVTITGAAAQNQSLVASHTLADVDGLGTISYQWKASGVNIAGATASTLVLGSAQIGKTITVAASYTDAQGTAESKTSAATATVIASFVGTAGADTLNGTTAADQMSGLAGNDTYVVNNVGDVVVENLNEGTDLVNASVSYTLAANVENITLTGTSAVNATGNALNNVLTGNSGANVLTGGAGDDTYVVGTGDTVVEALNGGIDTVQSGITHTLAVNVENLTLTGTSAINGTGNALDNVLTGNSAVNVLAGGTGNDTYGVTTGDTTTEAANAGTDTVQSAVAWTLATNLENLVLTGTAAVNGIGNTADNVLTGNSGANTLTGNAGNDTLDGKAGADALTGGTGNDTYWLGRGWGIDTITETDATVGNTDLARFEAGIATDQLWFRQVSSNLEVSIIGTTDRFTIANWYTGTANHVEQFKTSDGKTLLDSQVQNLVSAMAAFAPPAAGQTTLPTNYATTLAPVIAANWV